MEMVEQEQTLISENSVTSIAGDVFSSITISNCSSSNQIRVQNIVKKTETARFKGVSSHYNGHWGAQIYVNNQRIWLGTFKSEMEAAMAYDSAAIKLRNGDSHRNLPWTNITVYEPYFQHVYDVETILAMIKDGSYMFKFSEYLNAHIQNGRAFPAANPEVGIMGQELFLKVLTPSDVGNLNRLVIPKKFAVKYFPPISQKPRNQNGEVIPGVQDTDLYFYDRSRRPWTFRYCYWKSSQSFVLTRGWNRFVKEKNLRATDMVVFSFLGNYHMIDIRYSNATRNNVVEDEAGLGEVIVKEEYEDAAGLGEVRVKEENVCLETIDFFANERMIKKPKGLRLFGVQIV